ncbi:unnamed protein product [Clonostachys rosea]|uniref:Heterokaryon incompatibility domain-containing protein n=1 Tax=Bionectria ochroleuca TaxID=29856 RepID=A0ABY6TZS7_BIOOC|nr:unnamed protein product [Clonostachys rosea]
MASNELESVFAFASKYPRFYEKICERYQELLQGGHDPNEEWDDGRGPIRLSPLFSAIMDGNIQLTDLLLKFGADPTRYNRRGRTALHEAIVRAHKPIVELLLERETDPEIPLRSEFLTGGTALHLAVCEGQEDIVQSLLTHGCNPQARCESGWTPADVAILDHQTAVLEVLLSKINLDSMCGPDEDNQYLPGSNSKASGNTALLASHLLEHGVRGSDRQHYAQYRLGLLNSLDLLSSVTSNSNLAKALIDHVEGFLRMEAGIGGLITWARNLCPACAKFNTRNGEILFTIFDHCDDLLSLEASSENGCNLCQLLLEALDIRRCLLHQIDRHWIEQLGIKSNVRLLLEKKDVVPRFGSHSLIVVCGEKISFMDLNHVQRYINDAVSRTPPTDAMTTGSERSLAVAKAWVERCEKEHETCRRLQLGKLPTRVIEIAGDTHPPRIHISVGEQVPYAALSYCWGAERNIRLLSANVETYVEGIPINEIPQTIADALEITKALGLKYLWVDALCILQDSEQDLQHELSYMGEIYANAWLTIAPKNSASCRDGCFRERDWKTSAIVPLDIRLPSGAEQTTSQIHLQEENKRTSCVNRLMVLPRHRMEKNGKKSILRTRGWTLQEEILSRRMLHCSDRELSWACLEGRCTERIPEQEDIRGRQGWKYAMRRIIVTGIDGYGNLNKLSREGVLNNWLEIVENYLKRELSKPGDRLAAIQGVQEAIGRILNDVPVAGIWKGRFLAPSLLWKVSDPKTKSAMNPFPCPSWSWASVFRPSKYTQIPSGKTNKDWVWYHDVRYFVEATAWDVHDMGPNGIQGHVTLNCKLIKESDMNCEKIFVQEFPNRPPQNRAGKEYINMMIHSDYKGGATASDVWLMPVQTNQFIPGARDRNRAGDYDIETQFLRLKKISPTQEDYKRIGLVVTKSWENKWLEKASTYEIRLF